MQEVELQAKDNNNHSPISKNRGSVSSNRYNGNGDDFSPSGRERSSMNNQIFIVDDRERKFGGKPLAAGSTAELMEVDRHGKIVPKKKKAADSKENGGKQGGDEDGGVGLTDPFLVIFTTIQCLSLLFFGLFTDYASTPEDGATAASEFVYYNNIAFMMLIGFGFLMTFLKRYTLGSIGMTFLLTVMMIQLTILLEGFWEGVYNKEFHTIKVSVFSLVSGNFGAATILITFGCLIGKISLPQMAVLGVLELWAYTFNFGIVLRWLKVVDIGGSIAIHMFGAFFGMAAAWVWGYKPGPDDEAYESSSRTSDVFSLIGTIFLWVFWPSFNGAPAPNGSAQQLRVTINTVLALCACCQATFIASRFLSKNKGKFSPADIQNATLAGGVAIGSSANMIVQPWGAIAIGALGGLISTFGFRVTQPWIQGKLGLHDTCGVQNLHGWPSIIGGLTSAVVAAFAEKSDGYEDFNAVFPEGNRQGGVQVAGVVLTIAIAVASGALAALIVKFILPPKEDAKAFRDSGEWEVDEEEALVVH